MPTYKLTYFNSQTRAEVPRFLFALGDISYEDIRLGREDVLKCQADTPFGQFPTLQIDDVLLCQQRAIEGYLAKLVRRAGKGDLDYARCHMIADCVEDMFKPFQKFLYNMPAEEKVIGKKRYVEEQLPDFLAKFEKMLSKDGYFLGNELTWPDLSLNQMLCNMPLLGASEAEVQKKIDQFPNVKACMKQVQMNPKCEEWIAKRPKPY